VMRTVKIAHISDLHLNVEHRRVNIRNARRLIEFAQRQGADHIVITGDIGANAQRGDFEIARKTFDRYGLLDTAKLSLVIGNHDIYGGVHVAEDILSFPRRCRTTDYREKVKEFRHCFREAFEDCFFPEGEKPFPFGKMIGNVLLVGVNSIARHSGVRNPIGSNGEVDDQQMRGLEEILTSPLFKGTRKIVLIHHHFSKSELPLEGTIQGVWGAIERQTMKLRGKKVLLELFKKTGVDLVLHGHLHESSEYWRKGVHFLNAGGSSLGPVPGELTVNMVTINEQGVKTEIHRVAAGVLPIQHVALQTATVALPAHVAA
jgi:3',5'-cyclic AMP phosphodiesterase CpdA